ncbi:hypothetical protein L7F22_033619 [Adiantum nelumboides]|nr:hypothetical protein [Adiantum nelumboides]
MGEAGNFSTASDVSQAMEAMTKSLHDKLHLPPLPAEEEEQGKLMHMVMVPYPLQGHINPMMQFAKALVAKHSVKVSFINIKYNHDRIQKSRMRSASSSCTSSLSELYSHDTLKPSKCQTDRTGERVQKMLELLWIDNGLPEDYDCADLAKLYDFHTATLNMKEPLKQLLEKLNKKSQPISCVIFGSFCPWIHTISAELGIPSVFFWTQSTVALSIYYHAPLLAANGFFPYKKHAAASGLTGCNEEHEMSQETTSKVLVSYVPGVLPLPPSSIPTLLQVDGTSDPSYISLREQFDILKSCQGAIVNSFEELESDAYRAMQQELPFPVSLVGPLVPSAFLEEGDANDTSVGVSLLEERTECIEWLNRQKKQSVLYISFGSLFFPSDEDLASIFNGIKDSKQPFLWVMRPKSSTGDLAELLPKGFMDDTKERGIIISWAPQTHVLSHPSVGAFLTHCGWNSTLESVSMGVPMILCPLISDQPTNSSYVCEFWKTGMPLKRQGDGSLSSLHVARVVRIVLEEKEGEEMRKNAVSLREAARRAAGAQGSSCNHMEEFIQTIRSHFKWKS